MINPSLLGRDIERHTRELRALGERKQDALERSPLQRRSRRRFRIAIGTRLITWGESLTCEVSSVPMDRLGGQAG